MHEIAAPVIIADPDAVTLYPSAEYAENHLCGVEPEDFEGAWDADGNRLLITQSSGRVMFSPGAPDQERLRRILVVRLDRVGEILGDSPSLEELVERAAEHFSIGRAQLGGSGWTQAIRDHLQKMWIEYALVYVIVIGIFGVALGRRADAWTEVALLLSLVAVGTAAYTLLVISVGVTVWWLTHGRRR